MAFFPFFSQYDPDDCGVMALRMVCAWHGKALEPNQIRKACQVPFGELSFLSLNQGAESLGFKTISVRLQPHQWDQNLVLPAIAHVLTQHFVVIIDITEQFIHLADPLRGVLRINRSEFQKEWLFGEPLHLLILDQNSNKGQHKLNVKPIDKERIARWSLLTVFVILLEVFILFLLLQWLGFSVSTVFPITENRALGLGITLLLLSAFVFILWQWRHLISNTGSWATTDEDMLSSFSSETPYVEWIRTFHMERKASLYLLPRAIVLLLMLVVYMVVHWGSYGFWTLGIVALFLGFIWYYPSGPKANFVRKADQWLAHLTTWDKNLKEKSVTKSVFRKWVSSKLLWVAGFVWVFGCLALNMLIPLSLQDVFLLWSIGIATSYYVYLTYVGIRAYQWRQYRPVDSSMEIIRNNLPPTGEIKLKLDDQRELTFPYGKTTLLAGPFERDVAKIIQSLKTHSFDEGTVLSYGGTLISKSNRKFYLEKIVVLSKEKSRFGELDPVIIHKNSKSLNLPLIASVLMLPEENIGTFLDTPNLVPALEVKRMIGQVLILNPEWLVFDHLTESLDPFDEVILMENIIEYRQGRSTVIASNRTELIPTVNQVVYVNLKDNILVEKREDFQSA